MNLPYRLFFFLLLYTTRPPSLPNYTISKYEYSHVLPTRTVSSAGSHQATDQCTVRVRVRAVRQRRERADGTRRCAMNTSWRDEGHDIKKITMACGREKRHLSHDIYVRYRLKSHEILRGDTIEIGRDIAREWSI